MLKSFKTHIISSSKSTTSRSCICPSVSVCALVCVCVFSSLTYRKISNISPGLIFDRGTFFWAYFRGGLYSRGTIFERFFCRKSIIFLESISRIHIFFSPLLPLFSKNVLILNFLLHKLHQIQ